MLETIQKYSGVVTLILVVIILLMSLGVQHVFGASTLGTNLIPTTLSGGSYPTVFNALEATESFISDGASYVIGNLWLGGTTSATALQGKTTIGTCATATSTLFAILNPYAATSTVVFGELYGTQGASTTDMVVGTSTTPALALNAATTTLNENYMGLATVATGTQFFSVAGQKIGPGKGYTNPAGTPVVGTAYITNTELVVGPSEYLLGFSTTTYVTGANGAVNALAAIPSSCTYKFLWASQ